MVWPNHGCKNFDGDKADARMVKKIASFRIRLRGCETVCIAYSDIVTMPSHLNLHDINPEDSIAEHSGET